MKHLIIDLDNTIYPVKAIGDKLFAPLFKLLDSTQYGLSESTIADAKELTMRIPFQKVIEECHLPDQLSRAALELLRNLTYDDKIDCFEEYEAIRQLHTLKFLLTTGFQKLQESKIRALHIAEDFTEIFIIDPDQSKLTKKDAMFDIMEKYDLLPESLLVVGDDPESEIKAAKELGIASFLLDPTNSYPEGLADFRGNTLKDVLRYINET